MAQAGYLTRHWRGELSLPVSYWLNGFLGSIAAAVLALGIGVAARAVFTPLIGLVAVIGIWVIVAAIAIWQVVGVWRSANRRTAETGRRFWPIAAKLMAVLGIVQLAVNFTGTGVPQIGEMLRIATGDGEIGRRELRVVADGRALHYVGGIGFGAAEDASRALDAAPAVQLVILDSPGGRLGPARELRDLIRARGLATYSAEGCLSACTIAFVGGRERFLGPAARLGFHLPEFPGLSDQDLAAEVERDKRDLARLGVPAGFIARIYATPHDAMWFPTLDELRWARIVDAPARDVAAALRGGDWSRANVEAELLQFPLYRAVRAADPDLFAGIRDDLADGLAAGKPEAELAAAGRARVLPLTRRYLPRASADTVVAFAGVVIDQIEQLNARDPQVCYDYVLGTPAGQRLDLRRHLPEDLLRRELAAAAQAIETGATSPQAVPDAARGAELQQALTERLRARAPQHLAALETMRAPDADRAAVCRAIQALYRESLAMPRDQGVALLRFIFAGGR